MNGDDKKTTINYTIPKKVDEDLRKLSETENKSINRLLHDSIISLMDKIDKKEEFVYARIILKQISADQKVTSNFLSTKYYAKELDNYKKKLYFTSRSEFIALALMNYLGYTKKQIFKQISN